MKRRAFLGAGCRTAAFAMITRRAGARVDLLRVRHRRATAAECDPRRFFTIARESRVFHSVGDRWPEAIDVAQLARYAQALAGGAPQLARS